MVAQNRHELLARLEQMRAEAGYRVTSFVEGHPELFMGGLSAVFRLLALLVVAGLALSLLRTLVIERRVRRAGR